VRGLSKAYGRGAPVFAGIDFDVAPGRVRRARRRERHGQVHAPALLPRARALRTRARIELLGADPVRVRGAARRALRSRTGLVSQKHNLVPRLSVLSNVVHGLLGKASGPRYWSHALAPRPAREAAMHALDRVGLAHLALRRADGLSGGQSQRVAIARALVCAPRFLVADEPTASLDPSAGEEVMELFFRLARSEGVTVLFTSHNIDHALRYGDRVLGLAGGRLALDADARSLSRDDIGALYG
jgi:phosphonate transport system ATP-binding protein